MRTDYTGKVVATWVRDNSTARDGKVDFGSFALTVPLRDDPPLGIRYRIFLKPEERE